MMCRHAPLDGVHVADEAATVTSGSRASRRTAGRAHPRDRRVVAGLGDRLRRKARHGANGESLISLPGHPGMVSSSRPRQRAQDARLGWRAGKQDEVVPRQQRVDEVRLHRVS